MTSENNDGKKKRIQNFSIFITVIITFMVTTTECEG